MDKTKIETVLCTVFPNSNYKSVEKHVTPGKRPVWVFRFHGTGPDTVITYRTFKAAKKAAGF